MATNFYESNVQPKHILLVEDNRVGRLVVERLLRRWGYAVSLAADGLEALKMAALNAFDLILMNLNMPGLNGLETTLLIRRLNDEYGAVPVIALSANASQLRQGGQPFSDFLAIPYMPEQLKNLLQYYLLQVRVEPVHAPIRVRLDSISGQDKLYQKQLVGLFVRNCRELLNDLQEGKLDNAAYLSQIRHKHQSSLRLLELFSLEAALDHLQDALEHSVTADTLLHRKLAVAQQTTAVIDELSLLSS